MQKLGQFILFTRDEFAKWIIEQKITRKITRIQNHHTYLPSYEHFNGSNHFERLKSMDIFHERDRKFSDIAQNFTTFPDGRIALCRPLDIAPAGIYGQNKNAICIEHFGNFDKGQDQMTDEHKETIVFLNSILCKWAKLAPDSDTIVYHHWFDLNTGKRLADVAKGMRKSCPGTAFFGGNRISDAEAKFIPLIANKIKNINHTEVVVIMSKYFGDIPASHWGAKSADSLYEKNIVAGKGNGILAPNDAITRIEVVALIDRAIDYVLKEMAN